MRACERPELELRGYRRADDEAVRSLHSLALRAIDADAGPGPWDSDLDDIQANYLGAGGEFVVGTIEGRIVAMGGLCPTGLGRAELRRMRVHPEFQRRGLGQKVLEYLERRARELGFGTLHLDTSTKQTAALALYRKNGYVEVGRTTLGGMDVLLFEKRISGIFGPVP